MSYLKTLSEKQLSNIQIIIKECISRGITNKYSIAGLLAVCSKESGFIPKFEIGYSNTSLKRLRQIFPTKLSKLTDAQVELLKKDEVLFFNTIYGNLYGNGAKDGYKYRGGGLNQLTFKAGYEAKGKMIGVDLVSNPEKINQIEIAAAVVVEDFKNDFKKSAKIIKDRYGIDSINNIKDTTKSAQVFYNANAGFGKNTIGSKMDGYKLTLDRVDELYEYVCQVIH